ncbi:glutamate decarboxylase [Malassezia japonica]|uniref:Glutamate decarboxylase n=1 Tax=Malassezia japonica TaxID=223818 RepID=A0AAF0JBU4_9BASI|nr:glutamate decarboxylase [Malassezia japonica]WFD41202.1 glutamate decarboxylase [Malassezia japonica]
MVSVSPLHAEVSSEEYARLAPQVCAMIEEWMREGEREDAFVTPYTTPAEYRSHLALPLPDEGVDDAQLMEVMRSLLKNSVNPWTDRFQAKLYSAPTVSSMCGDMLLSAMNASVHVFSGSPVLSMVEEECVRALCSIFGFGTDADGITMPGGSASNTLAVQTSLCCAFNGAFRRDGIWGLVQELSRIGRTGRGARPVLLTGVDSHFSLDRAALAAGLGTDAVVHVPSDEHGRMRPDALASLLAEMTSDPAHPFGMPFFVNATSGSTVLGAFDDLEAIAALCQQYNCWLHVDASWGGPGIFSPYLRSTVLRGTHLANSLTINPHKLLNVTHQCSFLLVRESRVLEEHAIHAGYLFHDTHTPQKTRITDMAAKTLGCGRRGEALKLYLTWRKYGTRALGEHIDQGLRLAQDVLARIRTSPALEVGPLAEPLFLQICFRPRTTISPASAANGVHTPYASGSAATRAVHAALLQQRHIAVDFAPTRSGDYLRLVIHPRTPPEHYFALVEEVARLASIE